MAVVINEFEVVPAAPRPADSEPAPADAAAGGGAKPPKDPERELDRLVRKRHARASRLQAI